MSAFDKHFSRFLAAWVRHDDLRKGGGSVPQLVESRRDLDDLRLLALSSSHLLR